MGRIKDSDGNWIIMGNRLAMVAPEGGLCGIPLITEGIFKKVPQSPIYFDNAAHLRSLILETKGTVTLRFWRSIHPKNPANQADIEAAITAGSEIPQPDLSNNDWISLTPSRGVDFSEGGFHEVPREILDAARQSRWFKIDPIGGEFETMTVHPTVAGY